MIFINTRPVDEQAMAINRRKSSVAPPKRNSESACDSVKLSSLLVLIYLLLSTICVIFHYPLSFISLIVPSLLLFYLLYALRRRRQFDVWTASFLATLGLLIKGAGIVIFLSLFEITPLNAKRTRVKGEPLEPKSIFFIVLFLAEALAVVASLCLKWHLVAFRGDSELRQVVDQKRKESRVMSTS